MELDESFSIKNKEYVLPPSNSIKVTRFSCFRDLNGIPRFPTVQCGQASGMNAFQSVLFHTATGTFLISKTKEHME